MNALPHSLPAIAGFILTGQLRVRQAAHAPVILRHDLRSDFFGIEEMAAGWPDFRSFNLFPISAAALALLCSMLGDDPRHEIDTGHSAFGWVPRPKVYSAPLGLKVPQPAIFATAGERDDTRQAKR